VRGSSALPDGPHGRLGVAWAAVTGAALLAGPLPLAVWMAAHAALAAAQAARAQQPPRSKTPLAHPLGAAVGAALLVVGCAFGWTIAAIAVVLAGVVALSLPAAIGDPPAQPARTVALALAWGAAAGSLVLARWIGAVPALFLFALISAYDTGAYLVGTGAHSRWEGPAAGIAAIGPVTLGAAALAVPPFTELGPAALGGIAAVLAPLGLHAASRLVQARSAKLRLPAVRRLDVLLVLGPVWVVAAGLLRP